MIKLYFKHSTMFRQNKKVKRKYSKKKIIRTFKDNFHKDFILKYFTIESNKD